MECLLCVSHYDKYITRDIISLNLYNSLWGRQDNFIVEEKKKHLERLHNFATFAELEMCRIGTWIIVFEFWAHIPNHWVCIVSSLWNSLTGC